jgi:hypothetical protein
MDELTLIREVGEQEHLPDAARLAPARERLLAEAGKSAWSRRRVATLATATLATAGLAAGLVAVVAALQVPDAAPADHALVPVAQFLDQAAVTAQQDPDLVPRPDQFAYVKYTGPEGTTEAWYSIDGRHDGLRRGPDGTMTLPACEGGRTEQSAGNPQRPGCDPMPMYLPDLPTDTDAMVAWLKRRNPGEYGPEANVNGIGKDLWVFTSDYWLRPAQRAALYRAAAKISGLRLVEGVRDGSGRTGTGVAWVGPGETADQVMWIFDPETHLLLGSPTSSVSPVKLVDKVGER